jgi:hypothetical protein
MAELIPIIFAAGQTEATDPRVLDTRTNGKVQLARNVRWRKDGRAAKKYGNTTEGFSPTSGYPNALFEHNGRKYVVSDCKIRAKYGSTAASTATAFIGECSRFLPDGSTVLRFTESAAQPRYATVAGASNKVGYWWEEAGAVYRRIFRTDGQVISFEQVANGERPRAVATGTTINTVYRNGAAIQLLQSDFTADAPGNTSGGNIGTLFSSLSPFDAAPFTSTQYLTARYSALNVITVARMTGNIPLSQTITSAGAIPSSIAIMGTSGEHIYVAWVESTFDLKVAVLNATTLALTGGPTTITFSSAYEESYPQLIRQSATSALLVMGRSAAGVIEGTDVWTISSTGVASGAFSIESLVPTSRLFLGDNDVTRVSFWAQHPVPYTSGAGNSAGGPYSLVTLTPSTASIAYQFSGQPFRASFVSDMRPADVVSIDSVWYTALPDMLRSGGANADCVALRSVSVTSHNSTLRNAFRQQARRGPSVYLAGNVTDIHGAHGFETGFAHFPIISSLVVGAGGSVTTGAHDYRVVYEYLDDAGNRHRSAPSLPVTATTTAGNNTVTVNFSRLAFSHQNSSVALSIHATRAHVYRTKAGQAAPYYRCTPDTGAPDARTTGSFVDTIADADLTEILYTDGGVIENMPPPACRYIATVRNRLVVGGLFVPNKVAVSKIFVEGEPAQFTEDDAFALYVPEPVTGVAGLDDTIVIFAENSVYLAYGDGPNDQGIGAYQEPRRVAGDIGCIDHRSIVELPQGILFQSRKGLFLLPRGGGAPSFLGRDVQSTLAEFPIVQSAVAHTMPSATITDLPESLVRIVCGDDDDPEPSDTYVLTLDLVSGAWAVDHLGTTIGVGGVWGGAFAVASAFMSSPDPVRLETQDVFSNAGTFAQSLLTTGYIRPFGLAGSGRFCKLVFLGESRQSTDATVRVSWTIEDGISTIEGDTTFAITEAVGAPIYREVELPSQIGVSLRCTIRDGSNVAEGAGVVFHGILLDVQKEPGAVRLPAALRV